MELHLNYGMILLARLLAQQGGSSVALVNGLGGLHSEVPIWWLNLA